MFEIAAMSLTSVVTIPDPSSPKIVSNEPSAYVALGDIKENDNSKLITLVLPKTLDLLSNLLTDVFNGFLRKFSLAFYPNQIIDPN
jgi:hypothetical protein